MAEKNARKSKIGTIITILLILAVLSLLLSAIINLFIDDFETGNVAVIEVEGPIVTADRGFFGSDFAVSGDIIELIEKADEKKEIEAIIIGINSPGGSAVASDEIANAIKKTNKTTVAVIRDVGASGGYWVASSADHVIANRMSITGSIGAIASYLEFSGFLERYNISHERLVAGKYKDVGSPLRKLTPKEKAMVQEFLDEIHLEFIKEVAKNRGMSIEDVKLIATGMFFSGSKAKDMGLVDELGSMDDAETYLKKKLNATIDLVEYEKEDSLLDLLAGVLNKQSFSVGEGIGSALLSENNGLSNVLQ